MKKLLIKCLFTIYTVSMPVYAQTLWKEAKAGMTVKELKQAMKELTPPTVPEHMGPNNALQDLLIKKNIKIVNEDFTAHFYFTNNRLIAVHIFADTFVDKQKIAYLYPMVEDLLRDKYGKPRERSIEEGRKSTEWRSNNVDISLLYYDLDAKSFLKIIYSVLSNSSRNNL